MLRRSTLDCQLDLAIRSGLPRTTRWPEERASRVPGVDAAVLERLCAASTDRTPRSPADCPTAACGLPSRSPLVFEPPLRPASRNGQPSSKRIASAGFTAPIRPGWEEDFRRRERSAIPRKARRGETGVRLNDGFPNRGDARRSPGRTRQSGRTKNERGGLSMRRGSDEDRARCNPSLPFVVRGSGSCQRSSAGPSLPASQSDCRMAVSHRRASR